MVEIYTPAATTEVDSNSVQESVSADNGTQSATDSALHESDRSSDSSFVNTKDDTSSQRGDTSDADEQNDQNGARRCTRKWILELFKKEWKMYYRTFELNEKLYFHYKGFEKIENMELFPDLKCLYWEGNGSTTISGLESNVEMVSLYLQENCIKRIEGLSTLSRLHTLQLSDNLIQKIEGLSLCVNLDSLYIKTNRIGAGGLDDVIGLLEC
jgi:hypothetical protein